MHRVAQNKLSVWSTITNAYVFMHIFTCANVATNEADIMQITAKDKRRFWAKVQKSKEGCWTWMGSCVPSRFHNSRGYGQLGLGQRNIRAHRFSYLLAFGSIPEGLQVLHRCDNPECVRPDHLFLGTQTDNMRDRAAKGRMNRGVREHKGERNPSAKLTNAQVAEIYGLTTSGTMTQKTIAERYGVSSATVGRIASGRHGGLQGE